MEILGKTNPLNGLINDMTSNALIQSSSIYCFIEKQRRRRYL